MGNPKPGAGIEPATSEFPGMVGDYYLKTPWGNPRIPTGSAYQTNRYFAGKLILVGDTGGIYHLNRAVDPPKDIILHIRFNVHSIINGGASTLELAGAVE